MRWIYIASPAGNFFIDTYVYWRKNPWSSTSSSCHPRMWTQHLVDAFALSNERDLGCSLGHNINVMWGGLALMSNHGIMITIQRKHLRWCGVGVVLLRLFLCGRREDHSWV
jgi:hypothetical protein